MNRRDFLRNLFGAAAVATLPALPRLSTAYTLEQWVEATLVVHQDAMCDMLMYGVGRIESCEEFPFIRTVDPATLPRPTRTGGLLLA